MSIINDFNVLNLTRDLSIDLCYLTLYRLGGVKVVAFVMLIEWVFYMIKAIQEVLKEIEAEEASEETC